MKNKTIRLIRDRGAYAEFCFAVGMTRFNNIYKIVTFTAMAGLLITQLNRWIGTNISLGYTIILAPFLAIGIITYGHIDLEYLHVTQKVNEIATTVSPMMYAIYKKVMNKENN